MARLINIYHCPICGEVVSEWSVHHGYGIYAISRAHKGIQTKSYMHTKCLESLKKKGGDQDET